MLNVTRACELLVGLPAVNVLEVVEPLSLDRRLVVAVESTVVDRSCPNCGESAWVKDRPFVELVDLTCFGRPVTLRWRKHRLWCPRPWCVQGSWTFEDTRIAAPRLSVTDRAGRWATLQVGRNGRAVSEVAAELGTGWHVINDAVMAYGTALLDADDTRVGMVEALGVDEVLFARLGRWRTQAWSTSIVDVASGPATTRAARRATHTAPSKSGPRSHRAVDPHSPWQRGLNEHNNRLIRYWLPRGINLATTEALDRIRQAEHVLNHQPRRSLNWDTPHVRYHQLARTHQ